MVRCGNGERVGVPYVARLRKILGVGRAGPMDLSRDHASGSPGQPDRGDRAARDRRRPDDRRRVGDPDSVGEPSPCTPRQSGPDELFGSASFVTRRGSGEPFVAQRATSLLAMLGRASWAPTTAHISLLLVERAKDDEAQKRVEQGGWYVVTKNDYKRWLARHEMHQ